MTPTQAREDLALVNDTRTGRAAAKRLGYGALLGRLDRGNDKSSVVLAEAICQEIYRYVEGGAYG